MSLGLCLCSGAITLLAVGAKDNTSNTEEEVAVFAGGCFWCMQPAFDKTKGVTRTEVGYTGGALPNPTYEQVSQGGTGHLESIRIFFDPNQTSYTELLKIFWHNVDPLDERGQFCDKGPQYVSAIFYLDDQQKKEAEESLKSTQKEKSFSQIVTQIRPATEFYLAEDYHQKYYQKNPLRYKFYRYTCGRDKRLNEVWGSQAGSHGE